jgi:hypothetical protein
VLALLATCSRRRDQQLCASDLIMKRAALQDLTVLLYCFQEVMIHSIQYFEVCFISGFVHGSAKRARAH